MTYAIILLVAAAIYIIVLFNKMVRSRFLVQEAWSGIDVQLKRRHDLIPNLVELVKGYSSHEKGTLEEIVKLRNSANQVTDTSQRAIQENSITTGIKSIIGLAEAYPDLKASKNFSELQVALTEVEDQLQYARRYYNGAVRNLNMLVQSFPSNIIAGIFHFSSEKFFEIEYATERATPDIHF